MGILEEAGNGKSSAKIEANRKNALKSTGPKTLEGKEKVRLNALKHGLLAREILITEGNGQEDQTEFNALLEWLANSYPPVGPLEEMILERIAMCYWRLRRAVRYETGVLREGLDTVYDNFYNQKDWKGDLVNPRVNYETLKNEQQDIITVNRRCITLLKSGGDISKPFISDDLEISDHYWSLIERQYIAEDEDVSDLDEDRFFNDELPQEDMRAFLLKRDWTDQALRDDFIQQDLAAIEKATRRIQELEAQQEAERLHLSRLPLTKLLLPDPELDKLLRYETAIERQLYRAIAQLECLQRQRQGESIPPPLRVEMNAEN